MANKTNKNRKKTRSSTRSKAPVKEEKVVDTGIPMANDILGKAGEFAQDVRNEFTANGDASGEEVEDAAYEADVENETEANCDSFPEE